jgi:hypothetical protein
LVQIDPYPTLAAEQVKKHGRTVGTIHHLEYCFETSELAGDDFYLLALLKNRSLRLGLLGCRRQQGLYEHRRHSGIDAPEAHQRGHPHSASNRRPGLPLRGAHEEIPWEQRLFKPCPLTPPELLHPDKRAQHLEPLPSQVFFCKLF